MQPLDRNEFDQLKASGELVKRQDRAKSIGNHRIDTGSVSYFSSK
jgi:hypothetical protein